MARFVEEYFKKYVVLMYGLVIQALAIALMYVGGIGSGPFPVMVQGISRFLGISEGVANYILSGACILIAFFYNRKYITVNTVLTAVGFSLLLDPAMSMVEMVLPEVLPLAGQIFLTVAATLLIGISIGIILSANAGAGALECLQLGLNDKAKIPFVYINWGCNIFFIVVGWLMGGDVGMATITITLFLGIIIKSTTKVCAKTIIPWLGIHGLEVTD